MFVLDIPPNGVGIGVRINEAIDFSINCYQVVNPVLTSVKK
ncbi:hypothetical protein CKA32_001645 [Geitlerinema sp. FC II]|nr:hypothetical protein CKA32_001645 [Geitlerinema sp. FC II]